MPGSARKRWEGGKKQMEAHDRSLPPASPSGSPPARAAAAFRHYALPTGPSHALSVLVSCGTLPRPSMPYHGTDGWEWRILDQEDEVDGWGSREGRRWLIAGSLT